MSRVWLAAEAEVAWEVAVALGVDVGLLEVHTVVATEETEAVDFLRIRVRLTRGPGEVHDDSRNWKSVP
jgi:hypothetical protein